MSGSVGTRLVWPVPQSILASGVPNAGGKLFTYQTGTNTPQATYNDAGLTVPNTNPITLDTAGQTGSVFLLGEPAYKMVLEDANGNEIWVEDPVGFTITVSSGVPIGTQVAYGGASAPAGWLLEYGQAVSRTTYSLLFGIIGTAYGIGDGTTTFAVPDKRGRTSIGKDDMGGTPASRITAGVSGINGTVLAAAGGDQQPQAHTHTITDPGHTHTVTDPGHHHAPLTSTNFFVFLGSGGNSNVVNGVTFGGQATTASATTGITNVTADTGITATDSAESGAAGNVQPGQIDNWIIFAGA